MLPRGRHADLRQALLGSPLEGPQVRLVAREMRVAVLTVHAKFPSGPTAMLVSTTADSSAVTAMNPSSFTHTRATRPPSAVERNRAPAEARRARLAESAPFYSADS